ncbi:MAG: hypothetical protein ACK6CP_04250 [Pseudanabaena sp.]|nr:ATP-binding protein [Pseudanabaena sp. M090S1SP2A07QC]MCA6510206.1 ATP-binding protein [Pseudanabaena sp. M109S1SP2A07QC]MCA6532337.1 ATP-binding protein [Pseudanabaena sp. M125S2SP2A07QC]MCA6536625.1 ATP-binding protein [Pseudanabaena sp. M176S2SP2A07QC]MCA6540564.1 ATP-binding protein [Pseudanabaena sp. M037S2SP2A07QC]MCA6544416.1 ATP-binding protein [Pseudanabaena sp. M074S1SP2A07QC]MCA6549643.1 ATP-binding protein [Pseudanabaena sp. M152S2SP2A07QC]MCA6554311.1 ATP-binding protein [Pse
MDNTSTLERFAIEYDLDTLEELAALVEDSPSQSSKIIFSGHTGCGKSTLLADLAQKLHDRFFVVRFSIANTIKNTEALVVKEAMNSYKAYPTRIYGD